VSLEIFYLKVDELTPYSKNTRKHAEKDVRNIKKSIADYDLQCSLKFIQKIFQKYFMLPRFYEKSSVFYKQ
jgi:hypothetical protein